MKQACDGRWGVRQSIGHGTGTAARPRPTESRSAPQTRISRIALFPLVPVGICVVFAQAVVHELRLQTVGLLGLYTAIQKTLQAPRAYLESLDGFRGKGRFGGGRRRSS